MLASMIRNRGGCLMKSRCYRSASLSSSSMLISSSRSLSSSLLLLPSSSSSSSISVRTPVELHNRYQSCYHFSTTVIDKSSETITDKSSSCKVKEVLVYTGIFIDKYNNNNDVDDFNNIIC